MRNHFETIAEVEKLMSDKLAERVAESASASLQEAEDRFISYGIFPELGWGLVEAGTSQAERTGDPAFLYEMLGKFVSVSYRQSNQFDENGIHANSGYDYSCFVDLAIYVAAQNRMTLVEKLFCKERPLSKIGYSPMKHTANLLVASLNPSWKYVDKAVSQAERFVISKSNSTINRAFVSFFLGIMGSDGARCSLAIAEFAELYCKSDWGQYKPFTKPVFLYGLLSIANHIHPDIVKTGPNRDVLGELWSRLWTKYEEQIQSYVGVTTEFSGNLVFLNVIE